MTSSFLVGCQKINLGGKLNAVLVTISHQKIRPSPQLGGEPGLARSGRHLCKTATRCPQHHQCYRTVDKISAIASGPEIGRGFRGTQGVFIACSAIPLTSSGETPTSDSLVGMPIPLISSWRHSAASSPGRPMAWAIKV